MPNLEQTAVTAWLTELRPDPAISEWPPAVRLVETQAALPERLAALGTAFDDLAKADQRALADALCRSPLRDEVRAVLAQLGAARTLRLLHWLAEVDLPDCHTVIAALVEDDGARKPGPFAPPSRPSRRRRPCAGFSPRNGSQPFHSPAKP